MTLETVVSELEESTGLRAYVHAKDITGGRSDGSEVGVRESSSVVSASVFKVPVLVEATSQAASGKLSSTQRVELGKDEFRVYGRSGTAVFLDDISISLRDLWLSMMNVSDNRATDAVMDLVGLGNINAKMQELGLSETFLEGDCAHLFATMDEDEAAAARGDLVEEFDEVGAPIHLRALNPHKACRTTPVESSELLRRVWQQDGLDAEACAEVRRVLDLQVWGHRLRTGFVNDDINVSGKTGTLRHIRNEVGVVEYPDGGVYAVSVFLRIPTRNMIVPDFDRAIGTLGGAAVRELRGE